MTEKNIPSLKRHGIKLIEEFDLKKSRQSFKYDFELTEENILSFLKEKLEIEIEKFEIITKRFVTDDNLKFHIDDCQIVTLRNPPTYNINQYIHLEKNKYLFFNNKFNSLPKFTALFYSSDYGTDFTGGILTLADDTQIIAMKGTGIILDSREAHMVTPIKSGTRITTIVKIY